MRKNYLPKPDFQLKYVVIVAMMLLVVANLTSGLIYAFLSGAPGTSAILNLFGIQESNRLLPVILLSQVFSVIFVGIVTILLTHTTAGPIYNMENATSRIADGDLTHRVQLRKKDQLQDFAGNFNRMVEKLDSSIASLESSTNALDREMKELESSIEPSRLKNIKNHIGNLKHSISGFRTTSEKPLRK